ncbi:hypothetical protein GTV32_19175 [Gordonia sp. SID5947]|uniref:hypothetical protein n=1 Tax=Gordonia sp. SID5947 TaxID=2690315 RepID=UPI00136B89A8|nr:hypothetical protein [Gordonia sp. SID5947]MYR08290.1 hypothetical protein [Gordonia sp. SID5947]
MAKIDLIGGWGPRAQSHADIVAAGRQMLTAMPDQPVGAWVRFVERKGSRFMDAVPVDIADPTSLATAIESTSRRGDEHELRINRQDGPENFPVQIRVRAGSEHSDNRLLIDIEMPDADSEQGRESITDHMGAMISAWDPDWLKAGTYPFHLAQKDIGLAPKQIILGWRTYLSDRIRLDESGLADSVTVTAGPEGGRYVTLTGSPTDPDLADAASVRGALGYA